MPGGGPGDGGVVFNIGNQNADVINVAGRDQYNQINTGAARDLVQQLRDAVDGSDLPADVAPQVRAELDATDRELTKPVPEQPAVAKRLTRVAELLTGAGSVLAATTPLGAPLLALTKVLGQWAAPLRRKLSN
ncbi:MAG: hypothetical protein M3179_12915 [Actinomycetota bacterium]|nr:hypothetical protein [Actinomycetota bacterium]